MIVKVLGVLDLIIALILFLLALGAKISFLILLIVIIFLAVKSLPFIYSFCLGSTIDFVAGFLILINFFFNVSSLLFLFVALAIGQKGVASLL